MAIAFDNYTQASTTATSLTFSKTNTGSNLYTFIAARTTGGDALTTSTYAGNSAPLIAKQQRAASTRYCYMWGQGASASGANNVVINAGSSVAIVGAGISYTGAQSANAPDSFNSATTASGTTLACAITVVAANSVACSIWLTFNFSLTSVTNMTAVTGSTDPEVYDHTAAIGAGTFTETGNVATADEMATVIAAIAPFTAAGGTVAHRQMMMGIGK